MPVAAAIGAVGSLGSAFLTSNAATTASQQQQQTAQQALAIQQQQFGTAQQALQPFINAGQGVLPTLQSLLTPGPSQTSTLSQLPGFQFLSQWGNRAAQNALSAQGLGGSAGPVGVALSNYNQGLASTQWSNLISQLQQFAGMGQGGASALAGNAIASGGQQAQTLSQLGQAQAAGTLGSANALAGGISGTSNSLLTSMLLKNYMQNNPDYSGTWAGPEG